MLKKPSPAPAFSTRGRREANPPETGRAPCHAMRPVGFCQCFPSIPRGKSSLVSVKTSEKARGPRSMW